MSAAPPRWMSPPPTYDAHSTLQMSTSTSLKPYLQLPHLLSLTWLAYPILSLVFVAFRLQLSLSSSQDAVTNAKDDLLTSCKAAEQAATAAASMPRYMAIATNEQFADAINGSMNAARATLVMALTIMEAIINFIIDIYRSTFLCFLELVVRGGLSILISALQEFNNFIQSTAQSIRTSIQNDIATANSAIKSAFDGINKVNPFGAISAPQFNIPSLSALDNVTLPTDFQDALTKLNNSLPSVAELKDKVESLIDTPFELLKKDINDTFSGLSFNDSILPVPQQNLLSFCNDVDFSVVDDLGRDLIRAAKIGTIVLILLALLLVAANCALEWYKWRCLIRHLEYTRQAWISDPTLYYSGPASSPKITLSDHNLLMLQASSSHPLLTRIANNLAARLRLTPSQHTNLQWFFHYVFHPPALACFLIGFFGLLSVQIQLWALGPITAKYSDVAASTVSDFSNTIATSINTSMYNQSTTYANDVNGRVDTVQLTINNGLFGWVNGTTTELNTTINNFYTDIQNVVNTVFGGTILEQPAQDFIKCLIGTKVDAIESALTFLHDNLHIDMPRVNQSVLVLSSESVDEATRPIAAAAIGGGANDDQGLFGRLINTYAEGLRKERIMFAIFMGLWLFVVLMALGIIFWHSYAKGWVEARKRKKWQSEQRSGFENIVVPFRLSPAAEKGVQQSPPQDDLPAFTPMPSPIPPNVFSQSSLPSLKNNSSSDSVGNSTKQSEKSWDNFFGNRESPKPAIGIRVMRKPAKLLAIGRKRQERLVPDEDRTNELSEEEPLRRQPTLFSRLTGFFGRRDDVEPGSPTGPGDPHGRRRPNLQISVDRASSIGSIADNGPRSTWSASPTLQPPKPWTNILSPKKPITPPFPPRPRPRHATLPSDVTAHSVADALETDSRPAALAPPIHHGYGLQSRYPPMVASRNGQQGLTPPPDRHRRSMSVPIVAPKGNDSEGGFDAESSTPVTWLLTTTHARKSSSLNPFITPFDDEHRVTIDNTRPPNVRKSIPTNPFAAVAL